MAQSLDHSGFCKSNSTFYSKRKPIPLPHNPSLDLTTFISSQPHNGTIAYIDASTGHRLTFPQVWQAVNTLSTYISNLGIHHGDIVLILSPNSIYFPIICHSIMSLGAIVTTTNPLNSIQEISKQVSDSKPVLAFTTPSLLPKLPHNLPLILIQERNEPNTEHQNGNHQLISSLPEILKSVSVTQPGRLRERVSQEDTASLLYSSGTTGSSKGVMSTHRSFIAIAQTYIQRFRRRQTLVCTIPMFHVYGFAAFVCGHIAMGSTVVVHSRFDLDKMLKSIETYRATCLPVAPPVVIGMINKGEMITRKYDLSSLEWVLSGGAPLSKEVAVAFSEMYPTVKIGQGYGLTESASVATATYTVEEFRRHGSSGLLGPGMEARIVDPNSGELLGINRRGELWLRGPTIMKGYFNNPDATALTLNDEGWLRTGDLCYIDKDGYIFVVDRLKELIKYNGYQVPPAELEALLLSHPEIVDAAVIPFPDKEVGQYPMAYVVRNVGSKLSESGVINFVANQVASYKKIRRVSFVSAIPKSPSGKILKKDLIKLAISHL